jgi:predicted Holliday junction resolvase-like endonuclease
MDVLTYAVLALALIIGLFLGMKIGALNANRMWEQKLPTLRKDAAMRSRAVISGQVSEQMAPYLPGFNHNPSEARFIGKPIDFVVFSGLDGKSVDEVVFVEVKTGGSRVSPVERSLKDAIEGGRVRWEEYRFGG